MSHGFPCLMFPISRCISCWTDRCFSANPDDKVWPNPIPLIFRWIHSPRFHGCMIVWWGNAEPPYSLWNDHISLPAGTFESMIFLSVQVGYVRFLPWRVSSGWFFGPWESSVSLVGASCESTSQAKAPRSYPIRFHARHASHAKNNKKKTQNKRKTIRFSGTCFWRKPTWIFNFMNHVHFSLPPVQEGIGIWCWSSNAGEGGLWGVVDVWNVMVWWGVWGVEVDGFNGEFDWEVVWSVGEVDDFVDDDFFVDEYQSIIVGWGGVESVFPGFSEGSWWGCFCAFERDMCVCVLFVWFGFLGVAFMSYLDSGLLFDNNLGKTQLDKIYVMCQLLGFVSGLDYFSDFHIVVCIIREYLCQNIMAKWKVL